MQYLKNHRHSIQYHGQGEIKEIWKIYEYESVKERMSILIFPFLVLIQNGSIASCMSWDGKGTVRVKLSNVQ